MEKTPDDVMDEILDGAHNGHKDVEEIKSDLASWSQWLVDLINILKNFFEQIKGAFGQ